MQWIYLRSSGIPARFSMQRDTIVKYCAERGLPFPEDFRFYRGEVISGRVHWRERELGKFLLNTINEGDILYTAEVSRIGREVFALVEFAQYCLARGITVHFSRQPHIRITENTLDKEHYLKAARESEAEYHLFCRRMRDGFEHRKEKGLPIGRQKGCVNRFSQFDRYRHAILKCLEKGWSISKIARRLGMCFNMLHNYIVGHMKLELARHPETGVYMLPKNLERELRRLNPPEIDPWEEPEAYIAKHDRLPYNVQISIFYGLFPVPFKFPKDPEQRRLIAEAYSRREIPDFVRPMIERQKRLITLMEEKERLEALLEKEKLEDN